MKTIWHKMAFMNLDAVQVFFVFSCFFFYSSTCASCDRLNSDMIFCSWNEYHSRGGTLARWLRPAQLAKNHSSVLPLVKSSSTRSTWWQWWFTRMLNACFVWQSNDVQHTHGTRTVKKKKMQINKFLMLTISSVSMQDGPGCVAPAPCHRYIYTYLRYVLMSVI